MNIEEAIRELKGYLTWLEANGFSKLAKDSAIETLLTAYEKQNKIIDLMANEILEQDILNQEDINHYDNKHEVIKYFKERCHNG